MTTRFYKPMWKRYIFPYRSNTNMEPYERILIIRLTQWVLKNNYQPTYLQINGTAVGAPLAVTYAGLFMADIGTRALSKIKIYKLSAPIIYKRLMDDLASMHINKVSAKNFIDTLQPVLPEQITFTYGVFDKTCVFF
jgi:hypothetical protein